MEADQFRNLRDKLREQQQAFARWQSIESEVFKKDTDVKPYAIYDDSLEDMERSFWDVLPGSRRIDDYLRDRFPDRIGSLVGLELGGPASNFFGGFKDNFFKKTAGVTISDVRSKYQTARQTERDSRRGHTVIPANIFSKEGLKKVDNWLAGDKADFIIERMQAGWEINVKLLSLYAKYLAHWYERLNEQGVMLLQTPFAVKGQFNNSDFRACEEWVNLFRQKYGNSIGLEVKHYAMRLEKLGNAPDRIEVLRF